MLRRMSRLRNAILISESLFLIDSALSLALIEMIYQAVPGLHILMTENPRTRIRATPLRKSHHLQDQKADTDHIAHLAPSIRETMQCRHTSSNLEGNWLSSRSLEEITSEAALLESVQQAKSSCGDYLRARLIKILALLPSTFGLLSQELLTR